MCVCVVGGGGGGGRGKGGGGRGGEVTGSLLLPLVGMRLQER